MPTSLWCNLSISKYTDSEVDETLKKNIRDSNSCKTYKVDYNGQKSHRRDHLIGLGSYFFVKAEKGGPWELLGTVTSCVAQKKKDTDGTNIFSLTIDSLYIDPLTFRTKNNACEFFKWDQLNSFARTHGIIEH